MKKILLAEDDIDFANVLKQYLELHHFEVHWAKDGDEAWKVFQKVTFHICIFDVMMPKMDGFTLAELCINSNPEIPFLFLTARNQNEDKIKGLKLGADDYIVKPFEADELVLRITNILKRTTKTPAIATNSNEIPIGKYLFHTYRLELKLGTQIQQLTEREAALITFLFTNKNQLLKRDQILKAVWKNDDYFSGRSMDVFISKLRKYFSEDSSISIESVRNIGLEFKVK
ncbi:response regulator transcription factor [Flavobacterium sp. N1994]|uniref:response regulator transcription factor n=1 Tax=Flavobacterium sp. N1994 TaxID=2986827 RepID=UPI002221B300|nr:response regulator transcription factor [Flavobacterium sp. N1994]